MKPCNELPRTILNLAAVVMLSVSGVSMLRGDTLYFGGGVPKMFGGKEQGGAGVFAYSVMGRNQ